MRAARMTVGAAIMWMVVAVVAGVAVIGLAACAEQRNQIADKLDQYQDFAFPLADGRKVTCVEAPVGISCDWENAK